MSRKVRFSDFHLTNVLQQRKSLKELLAKTR